jgi:hypothetical protein
MNFNLEDWLSRSGRAQDILRTIYEITQFSESTYAPFFQNCGLYAVGSSLKNGRPNDVDLVLVGLDFRAVAKYDKIFLQDPETLIAEEIVIPPALARQRGVVNSLSCMVSSSGVQSLWHPLPEAPGSKKELGNEGRKRIGEGDGLAEIEPVEPDRLEDLDYVHQSMLQGIEYRGEYWAYNFQKGMAGSTALNLDNYCLRQGSASQLVVDFFKAISSAFGQDQYLWHLVTPFEPYFHQQEYFLTCRFPIHEEECPARSEMSDENCRCLPIDLIVHAENLHVVHWKQHQRTLNYPFACLHEWPRAGETTARPILTDLPYPEFIDPRGKERVRRNKYFLFLREAPINV